jgi:cell division septation protein DedD
MMRRLLLLLVPALLQAQTADTSARNDSTIVRARKLGMEGREGEGRRLLDSLIKTTTPDSALYAEALYARASLATTAVDAERDYRRLLIEAPLAARAEDALLQLAQLLQARGDRRGASEHLQRFMLTYANSPARPRVALSLVRLLFEQGPQQQARACEALKTGRDAIPAENLELRNQLEFYAPRCAVAVESTPVTDTVAPPVTTPPATPAPPPVATSPSPPTPYYSVQVAAYNSREPAVSMANMLVERGLDARVDGTAAPFRVRVGKYPSRAEAAKAAATLKAQGHNGFITIVR